VTIARSSGRSASFAAVTTNKGRLLGGLMAEETRKGKNSIFREIHGLVGESNDYSTKFDSKFGK
jgi:hypothetical protein